MHKPSSRSKVPETGLLKWFRGIGFCSILLGGAGLVRPEWFWFCIACLYGGLFLLLVDLWLERSMRWWQKPIVSLTIVGVALIIYLVLVVKPHPIDTYGMRENYTNTIETQIGITIDNTTDEDYEDFSMLINPDEAISRVQQISSIPGCSIAPVGHPMIANVYFHYDSAGIRHLTEGEPIKLIATDAGYRVSCPKLPARNSLQLSISFVDIIYDPKRTSFGMRNWVIKDHTGSHNHATYWKGFPEGDVYAKPPTVAQIPVIMSYTAGVRNVSLSRKVQIIDPIG